MTRESNKSQINSEKYALYRDHYITHLIKNEKITDEATIQAAKEFINSKVADDDSNLDDVFEEYKVANRLNGKRYLNPELNDFSGKGYVDPSLGNWAKSTPRNVDPYEKGRKWAHELLKKRGN